MAALRYPELTRTLQGDLRLDEIDTRIAAVGTAIVAASDDEDTGGLATHQELLKIEQLLAFANFLFHKKKYNDAINAYKATLGKILITALATYPVEYVVSDRLLERQQKGDDGFRFSNQADWAPSNTTSSGAAGTEPGFGASFRGRRVDRAIQEALGEPA